jgi:hypothetical protein
MQITRKEYESEVEFLKKVGLTEEEIEGYFELYDIEVLNEIFDIRFN